MPKWEYKTLFFSRGWEAKRQDKNETFHMPGAWNVWWENNVRLPDPVEPWKKLNELGGQGWELVGVVAQSDYLGGASQISGNTDFGGFGRTSGITTDYAGFTTGVEYVFKRPLE
jgi:hypothetical protein